VNENGISSISPPCVLGSAVFELASQLIDAGSADARTGRRVIGCFAQQNPSNTRRRGDSNVRRRRLSLGRVLCLEQGLRRAVVNQCVGNRCSARRPVIQIDVMAISGLAVKDAPGIS